MTPLGLLGVNRRAPRQLVFQFESADRSLVPRTAGGAGTWTRAGSAYVRGSDGIFAPVTNNVPRFGWDKPGGNFGAWLEGAGSYTALGSCNCDSTATYWAGPSNFTFATVPSCIAGQNAYRNTNTNVASAPRSQAVGTFVNGQTDCGWIIIENVNAVASSLSIYDTTQPGHAAAITMTWSTLGLVVAGGTPAAYGVIDLGTGPNGGRLVLLWTTVLGTASGLAAAGHSRGLYFYPTAFIAATTGIIVHYAMFAANTSKPLSPIVTVGSTATRAADLLSFPIAAPPTLLDNLGVSIYDAFIAGRPSGADGYYADYLLLGSSSGAIPSNGVILTSLRSSDAPNTVVGGVELSSSIVSQSAITTAFSPGDLIERLLTVTPAGVATLTVAKAGGAGIVGSSGAASGWPASFDAQTVSFNGSSSQGGAMLRKSVRIATGIQTLTQMQQLDLN